MHSARSKEIEREDISFSSLVELASLASQLLIHGTADLRGGSVRDVLPERHGHRLEGEPQVALHVVSQRVALQLSLDGAGVECVRRDAVSCNTNLR